MDFEATETQDLAGREAVRRGRFTSEPFAQERPHVGWLFWGMVAAGERGGPGGLLSAGAGAQVLGVKLGEASEGKAELLGGGLGFEFGFQRVAPTQSFSAASPPRQSRATASAVRALWEGDPDAAGQPPALSLPAASRRKRSQPSAPRPPVRAEARPHSAHVVVGCCRLEPPHCCTKHLPLVIRHRAFSEDCNSSRDGVSVTHRPARAARAGASGGTARCSPELNPVVAIGGLIMDQIGNLLWKSLDALEAASGEELRPIYRTAANSAGLVSPPWLIEQVSATAAANTALTCHIWHKTTDVRKKARTCQT